MQFKALSPNSVISIPLIIFWKLKITAPVFKVILGDLVNFASMIEPQNSASGSFMVVNARILNLKSKSINHPSDISKGTP